MSYKAFSSLKEHMELEMLKSMTPEEINGVFNSLNDKIKELQEEIRQLRLTQQIPESVIKYVWYHGVSVGSNMALSNSHADYNDYAEVIGEFVVEEMKK